MICSLRAVVPTLLHYGSSMSQLCRGKDRERVPPDASGEDGVVASSRRPVRGGGAGDGEGRREVPGGGSKEKDKDRGERESMGAGRLKKT
jgi:hypothetical protein